LNVKKNEKKPNAYDKPAISAGWGEGFWYRLIPANSSLALPASKFFFCVMDD